MESIAIERDGVKAEINLENGQLVSLTREGVEFFHDGGRSGYTGKGWNSSEIVCFPVFGPVKDFRVQVGDFTFPLDQHGISRHTVDNPFLVEESGNDTVALVQRYSSAGVRNPKFLPGGERPEFLHWLPYALRKEFRVGPNGLECNLRLTNKSVYMMPYMIGWHPSFRVLGDVSGGEFLDERGTVVASLENIMSAPVGSGSRAHLVRGSRIVTYRNNDSGNSLRVAGKGFCDTTLLWSPGPDAEMFCIEHTSQLPDTANPAYFGKFRGSGKFETLLPGECKDYSVSVEPILG